MNQIKINKMALPDTNISVTMVKAELGASTMMLGGCAFTRILTSGASGNL